MAGARDGDPGCAFDEHSGSAGAGSVSEDGRAVEGVSTTGGCSGEMTGAGGELGGGGASVAVDEEGAGSAGGDGRRERPGKMGGGVGFGSVGGECGGDVGTGVGVAVRAENVGSLERVGGGNASGSPAWLQGSSEQLGSVGAGPAEGSRARSPGDNPARR